MSLEILWKDQLGAKTKHRRKIRRCFARIQEGNNKDLDLGVALGSGKELEKVFNKIRIFLKLQIQKELEKTNRKFLRTFTQFPPMVTSYVTLV